MKLTLVICGLLFAAIFTSNTIFVEPSVSPSKKIKYLFYLHGKIVEDQGVNAVHPQFGAYEYLKIVDTFKVAGFQVISEVRNKDADGLIYADKVVSQIDSLLKAKVSPENITVVGASKGAGIAVFVSSKLKNDKVNFVIMGVCGEDGVGDFPLDMTRLCGNILSVYEKSDPWAKTCQKLINAGACVGNSKEIELKLGNGHGFLYRPYQEWVVPAIEWARGNQKK